LKTTWSWLEDWVEMPGTPEELAALLAMRGFPVQSMERGVSFDPGIVIGEVLEVGRHPNADRLSLCSVTIGSERLSIVCGAPNVAVGQRVAVATIGSKLPDGTKLRKSKIRGVESEGMICSQRELMLSDEAQGIWAIPGEPPIGAPLSSVVTSSDTTMDVEVTSNRTDCMAVRGLAREIASARNVALKPRPAPHEEGGERLPNVEIENAADCPRYTARLVTGLRVGPSPDWLRRRVEAAGFRSISNVVDATNYVLREYGQPIHAFDASKIGGHAIRVRRGRDGEKLTLLDGREVPLGPQHLVIADKSIPVALAGVMGGLSSGVTGETTTVILESAEFDAALTQETARALGIDSDAAARFAQGVDPAGVSEALDAVARLLSEVAGGKVARGRVDQWPGKRETATLRLSRKRVEGVLGLEIAADHVSRALRSLEIEQTSKWKSASGDEVAEFRAPTFRKDLEIEEDLIEEVARVVGYDAIPTRLRARPLAALEESVEEGLVRRLRQVSCGLGFSEAVSTVLVGDIPVAAREGLGPEEIWELQNPKSRELKHLRVSLLPALVAAAARNHHRGVSEVRLFEVGKVFRAVPPPLGSERWEATLWLSGVADPWNDPDPSSDRYLELKGALEAVLEALGIDSTVTRSYHESCWKAGSGGSIFRSERRLARFGEIDPGFGKSCGMDARGWAAVLDVGALAAEAPKSRRYQDIPKFPAVKRDLAVVVPREVTHAALEKTIRESGGALLSRVRLFDVFEGRAIGEGRKSMAYALEFRAPDRTLQDREVDGAVAAIVDGLKRNFDAAIRGADAGQSSELRGSPT
jgi:phenylalanyl-tRNA synthetase beta chain